MENNMTPLASLSLTHVYYDPSDPLSYLCAFLALVPQALCVVYATLIWSTREVEVGLMFAGQLACEAVNFALKRIIKEERPKQIHGKGYGMPSSHAQFVFFWAVALCLFLLIRHRPRAASSSARSNRQRVRGQGQNQNQNQNRAEIETSPPAQALTEKSQCVSIGSVTARDVEAYAHQPWSFVERALASLAALVLAGMVAWSRIYLNYHTPKQVLVGSLAGILSAVGWFGVTYVMRQTGLLALSLDVTVARWFRLRDLLIEEDMCQAGWEKWENRRLAVRQDKRK